MRYCNAKNNRAVMNKTVMNIFTRNGNVFSFDFEMSCDVCYGS